jgi:SAM-dependent methyltransferase
MNCVVCGAATETRIATALGARARCPECLHEWRTETPGYDYGSVTMCSLGTSRERLLQQIALFGPYTAPGAKVLELGCATGELASVVREELDVAAYHAIEISAAGEAARAHVDVLYDAPLTELLADPSRAEGLSGAYDLVIASHVLEHLIDPHAEVAAMVRVLGPGGSLFLEVPNRSGHQAIPYDDNQAHLHFYGPSSLARLLAAHGLDILAMRTGARLDARYADSIQLVARRVEAPSRFGKLLSDHPLFGENHVVVWGAGSLASELLANYFDSERIAFFVDKDPGKHDGTCLGRPVYGPEAIGETPRTVLINSIDFEEAIIADLGRLYPSTRHRIVRISEVLDSIGPL